jgi:hypothetical protein
MGSKPCRNQEISWGKTMYKSDMCNSGLFAISGQKSKISLGLRQRGHSFFTEHLLTALGPEKARGLRSTGARLTNKYSFCYDFGGIWVIWMKPWVSCMFQCVPWCSMCLCHGFSNVFQVFCCHQMWEVPSNSYLLTWTRCFSKKMHDQSDFGCWFKGDVISAWWFGTFFVFHFIYGMSSFPLTNSIIFQDW